MAAFICVSVVGKKYDRVVKKSDIKEVVYDEIRKATIVSFTGKGRPPLQTAGTPTEFFDKYLSK